MTDDPRFDPKRADRLRSLLVEQATADAASHSRRRWPPRRRSLILLTAGLLAGIAGTGGAAWALSGQTLYYTPSSTPGGAATLGSIPQWPVNERGDTYGSQGDSAIAPDLIRVVATNGREGYSYSRDLEAVQGNGFTSPEEALAWQEENHGTVWVVAVYASDGVTRIGSFRIGG